MSRPACRGWADFVEKLEFAAELGRSGETGDLVQRAARAVRKLRFGAGGDLAGRLAHALSDAPTQPPAQTVALAAIPWPLVLTTNYDDHYVAAAYAVHRERLLRSSIRDEERRRVPLTVLGRSAWDCQRVLRSLNQPDVPILWALQGFVGGQADLRARTHAEPKLLMELGDHAYDEVCDALRDELVVGHAEYRRVAAAVPHFRRAFGEVYRRRSLLFLGSGLTEKYFLDLFGEIIELYGPSPYPHFAVMCRGESDPDFLRSYFGIWVHEVDSYDVLPDWIQTLGEGISARRVRRVSWVLGECEASGGRPTGFAGLRVLRGTLPEELSQDECVVFSAGGTSGRPRISHVGKRILQARKLDEDKFERDESINRFVWRHSLEPRYLAVNARLDPWASEGARLRPTDPSEYPLNSGAERKTAGGRVRRDLRLIAPAMHEVLTAAEKWQFRAIHTMLIASGELRTFPQSYCLHEMVRGWARWRLNGKSGSLRLMIYVTAQDVLHHMESGLLDLGACVAPDHVEFWIEIIKRDGEVDRHFYVTTIDRPLIEVLAEFAIQGGDWRLEIAPKPCLDWANWTLADVRNWEKQFERQREVMSLERFGILTGSTLTLVQPK